MTACRHGLLAAFLGLVVSACAPLAESPPGAAPGGVARSDVSRRFTTFISPKTQHAPPFLAVPDTNFYSLRSVVDRDTGETVHQLYVSDSYSGPPRDWNAARDGNGNELHFVAIAKEDIGCPGGSCFDEDFAADIPESALRASPQGFAVTFSAKSGAEKTIRLSGSQIAAQLDAVDAWRQPVAQR